MFMKTLVELSKSEQIALFEAMKRDLIPEESMKGREITHRKARNVEKNKKKRDFYKRFAKIKGLQHENVNERHKIFRLNRSLRIKKSS